MKSTEEPICIFVASVTDRMAAPLTEMGGIPKEEKTGLSSGCSPLRTLQTSGKKGPPGT